MQQMTMWYKVRMRLWIEVWLDNEKVYTTLFEGRCTVDEKIEEVLYNTRMQEYLDGNVCNIPDEQFTIKGVIKPTYVPIPQPIRECGI